MNNPILDWIKDCGAWVLVMAAAFAIMWLVTAAAFEGLL